VNALTTKMSLAMNCMSQRKRKRASDSQRRSDSDAVAERGRQRASGNHCANTLTTKMSLAMNCKGERKRKRASDREESCSGAPKMKRQRCNLRKNESKRKSKRKSLGEYIVHDHELGDELRGFCIALEHTQSRKSSRQCYPA
jgi:hypothetical protein